MLLANIPPPPFDAIPLGPLNLNLYGLLIATGAFLALRMIVQRYERFGGDPAVAEKAALIALGAGLLGARVGYTIPRLTFFLDDPLRFLRIWEGGLTFFGGLAGGALGVVVYVLAKRLTLPPMADAVAPALPLAQAIGRWGNYFNQELFGRPTDLPWALRVEAEHVPTRFGGETTFHPTFLYESLWNITLVGVLLWVDRTGRLRRRGSLMFVYLIGYGIGRGWIEALRVDTVDRYLGLSRNNWIAILIVFVGAVGLIWWERRDASPRIDAEADAEAEAGADAEPEAGADAGAEAAAEADDDPEPPTADEADAVENDPQVRTDTDSTAEPRGEDR